MTDAETHSTIGAVTDLAGKVVTNLTPQFLALIVITLVFNLGLMWFLQSHDAQRIDAMKVILGACTEALAHSAPVK